MKLVKTYKIPEWIDYFEEYIFEYPCGNNPYQGYEPYFGLKKNMHKPEELQVHS